MHCTFCIVPRTRGNERSRSIEAIVREVEELVARGVKEVTFLGQIVNLYGRHEFATVKGKTPFVQLLEAVHEVEGLQRLRFTSPHPIGFKDDLIRAIADLPKLAEHVHLPLQSGSNPPDRELCRRTGLRGEVQRAPEGPVGTPCALRENGRRTLLETGGPPSR